MGFFFYNRGRCKWLKIVRNTQLIELVFGSMENIEDAVEGSLLGHDTDVANLGSLYLQFSREIGGWLWKKESMSKFFNKEEAAVEFRVHR
jgi:hypothetical protein